MLIPGGPETLVRLQKLGFIPLLRTLRDLATGRPAAQRGLRLDGKSVERKMVSVQL
jgi:hypothetical protein